MSARFTRKAGRKHWLRSVELTSVPNFEIHNLQTEPISHAINLHAQDVQALVQQILDDRQTRIQERKHSAFCELLGCQCDKEGGGWLL